MDDITKILVVDDEAIIQNLLREYLEPEFKVLVAGDGEAAARILAQEPVDIVFTDQHMPRMTGVELLKHIRENHPGLPVVMMDSFPEISVKKMKELGAVAFVHKPFYLKEIRAVLMQVMDERLKVPYMGEERRKEQRFTCVLEVSYSILGAVNGEEKKTLSKNLSFSGMLIETEDSMPLGTMLSIRMRLLQEEKKFREIVLRAVVVWNVEKIREERYDTGLRFLPDQPDGLSVIKEFLQKFFM